MTVSPSVPPKPSRSNVVPLRRPIAAPERRRRKQEPRITLQTFLAMDLDDMERRALDPASPDRLFRRLVDLAQARCNHAGHAHFSPGDLARLLATVDRATGEVRASHSSRISEALGIARNEGLIAAESEPTLVIIPAHRAQQGRGSRRCPTCRQGRFEGMTSG